MSRLKNFSRNLVTSYLQLGVNVIYSLVSVPLILHWLPKAQFGLWSTLVQLMSYIALVDLGLNGAIARILVDHKDRRDDGEYGSLIKTSALVSAAQGAMVLAIVALGAPLLARWMKVPDEFQAAFIGLMRLQGLIAAFTFCMNPLSIMLNAHQRADVIARQSMINLVLGLGLLWLFLARHCGVISFVYANAITAAIAPWQYLWECWRLELIPRAGEWGKTSWRQFKEVFLFGKDVFLMSLGAQLITASQIIIISRTLGLEAVAAWAAGTKIFMLVRQIIFQPTAAASAGMCEMLARKETERLKHRFRNLVVLTASLGVWGSVAFALCNSLFIQVWTRGVIAWSPANDVLLGWWLFIASIQTTHSNFVIITKTIGSLPYVLVLEGGIFMACSLAFGYREGIPGIIACSAICLALISCHYSLWRTARHFQVPVIELVTTWIQPSYRLALALVPLAVIVWLATDGLPPIWRLTLNGLVAGLVGGLFFLRLGLPSEIIRDVETRIPRPVARVLARVVAGAV
jgi:O-antigen/teichoic acid export membrane protein